MPFRLTGAIGVYRHRKLLRQSVRYTSCDGRYSICIKNLPNKPSIAIITHRNTPSILTNQYMPDMCVQFKNNEFHITIQIPWKTWNTAVMTAADWNIVQTELELAIATAKEIEHDILPQFISNQS